MNELELKDLKSVLDGDRNVIKVIVKDDYYS